MMAPLSRRNTVLAAALFTITALSFGAVTSEPAKASIARSNGLISDLQAILVKGTGKAAALSPAELQDATTYAKGESVPLDTAITTMTGQSAWDKVVDHLQDTDPSEFVNAGREVSTGRGAWITLADKPSDQILSDISSAPFDVTVRYGVPANSGQLESIGSAAFAVIANSEGVLNAEDTIDPHSGAILVSYRLATGTAELPQSIIDVARQAALRASGAAQLPVPLSFQNQPDLIIQPAYAGGASLWDASNGSFTCTSGFNVHDNGSGYTGTITAQHCANGLLWGESQQSGIIKYIGPAPTVSAGKIDIQWHESINGQVASNNFQATGEGTSDRRQVTASTNAHVGDTICKWGWGRAHAPQTAKHSAYGCSTVETTDGCESYDSATWCGENHINDAILNPGDSGGPVFYGNTAVGINSAVNESAGWSTYTQESRLKYMDLVILQ